MPSGHASLFLTQNLNRACTVFICLRLTGGTCQFFFNYREIILFSDTPRQQNAILWGTAAGTLHLDLAERCVVAVWATYFSGRALRRAGSSETSAPETPTGLLMAQNDPPRGGRKRGVVPAFTPGPQGGRSDSECHDYVLRAQQFECRRDRHSTAPGFTAIGFGAALRVLDFIQANGQIA